MIESEETLDARSSQECGGPWKLIEELNRKLYLERVAELRHVTERLRVPNTVETWKSWFVNEALTRTWRGIQQANAPLLLTAATMLLTVAQLDERDIHCSSKLPVYPDVLFQHISTDAFPPSSMAAKKECQAWSSLTTLRTMCRLTDTIVEARQREAGLPVPGTLPNWGAWLIHEATMNIVDAAAEHGNPMSSWGSAWLFRLSSHELAGVVRLYELGVRPDMTSFSFPLLHA
ncbi:hypothetical protein KSF_106740 [Reticulibacter mediterranei]|uniref:Uncharacterized protein n=1 Tax=Reticulibacter mediterranei TaxID=2778369 RepID=A0A8J3J4M5_9CHLR|nr:hypothetical protein [Reticulibacter mediterranei]GHP00627.1 hypothetical protein KSF_106740 [Reticulibacter mediterranei]